METVPFVHYTYSVITGKMQNRLLTFISLLPSIHSSLPLEEYQWSLCGEERPQCHTDIDGKIHTFVTKICTKT